MPEVEMLKRCFAGIVKRASPVRVASFKFTDMSKDMAAGSPAEDTALQKMQNRKITIIMCM
jgi:hypothetical protein